jgi:hypothetical protein
MSYVEKFSLKDIAVNILQTLKTLKVPLISPLGYVPVDVKSSSAVTVVVSSLPADYTIDPRLREKEVIRQSINNYNKTIVSQS